MATKPLSEKFPINSVLELTLKGQDAPVKGVVYCTDEVSRTVVLKKALTHTTLASEIVIISADSVTNQKVIEKEAGDADKVPVGTVTKKALEAQEKKAIRLAEEALLHINQKVRHDMICLAHFDLFVCSTNTLFVFFLRSVECKQASPEGQAVFDRLLKACNEVEWRGDSIQVLKQIQVDPPYGVDNCRLLSDSGRQVEGSLDRVKKIVGHSNS